MSKIRQIDNAEVLHSIFIGQPVYMLRKISEETTFAEAVEADAFIVLDDEEEDETDGEAGEDVGTDDEGDGTDGISEDIPEDSDTDGYECAQGQEQEIADEDEESSDEVKTLPPDVPKKYPAKKRSKKKTRGDSVDHGKIVACRRAGRSISWIAEECRCSTQTVYNHLKKEGLR